MNPKFVSVLLIFLIYTLYNPVQAQTLRWGIKQGGIEWKVKNNEAPHSDHIEMSGRQISAIVTYGTGNEQELRISKKLIFPMLRTIPDDTHASYQIEFSQRQLPVIIAGGQPLKEKPQSFFLNGILKIRSNTDVGIVTERQLFTSTHQATFIEMVRLINGGKTAVKITVPKLDINDTSDVKKGLYGAYIVQTKTEGDGDLVLQPGTYYDFYTSYTARMSNELPRYIDAVYEQVKRSRFLEDLSGNLVLKTPNDTLNRMFEFAKIRSAESIFDTRGGLMHSPGGGAYYAAIWANDQAEYINPFFPYLGNVEGNASALNSFRHFARFMNTQNKPIPSSIIAEGRGIWNGAGDRGDQAMIAYGAALFALAHADADEAKRLWPLIDWCLAYLRTKLNKDGVIDSDSDELEGRFPAGKANLSTNSLAYGAMIASSNLAKALKMDPKAKALAAEALLLKSKMEKYFGATVQGFHTYKYYQENTILRAWICLPLVMGILDRKEETLKALLSPQLWTRNGILTASGDSTFWDRGTLYAFRGLFYGGATDTTMHYFNYYSAQRLLGEHVPYAVEAWPEGNQRHLSAESALYCRTVTEGLFGINPLSFTAFSIKPNMPAGWKEMSLNNIRAFQTNFSIKALRQKKGYKIIIMQDKFKDQELIWDGHQPLTVQLNK